MMSAHLLPDPEKLPGYRRRIVIEPSPGSVSAELEDDFHRMAVTLRHEGGIITGVSSAMPRGPWTTCDGAMDVLDRTFTGKRLDDRSVREARSLNCTHLYDLATFCTGHADGSERVTYDIFVNDVIDGVVVSKLYRNGELFLHWVRDKGKFVLPEAVAGLKLAQLGDWIAGLSHDEAEAARILRWATMVGGGRTVSLPTGMKGAALRMSGSCHTFQPVHADVARRKPGAHIDFSAPGREPLADRSGLFAR